MESCEGSSHRLFISSNETNQSKTIQILKQADVNGDLLIAPGVFFPLNMAAARGEAPHFPENYSILIIDNSKFVSTFWNYMKNNIPNWGREECIKNTVAYLKEHREFFIDDWHQTKHIEAFIAETETEISWLSCDRKFETIQKIFKSNRFVCKLQDFSDYTFIKSLSLKLREDGFNVDLVWPSSIKEYVRWLPSALYVNTCKKLHEPRDPSVEKAIDACAIVRAENFDKGIAALSMDNSLLVQVKTDTTKYNQFDNHYYALWLKQKVFRLVNGDYSRLNFK